MPSAARNWISAQRRKQVEANRPHMSYEERKALANVRRESQAAGALLSHKDANGGLPHSVALGVFRRDGWRCVVHGDRGEGEYGGLELHHRRYTPEGRPESIKNIYTVCAKAHDEIHNPSGGEQAGE